MHPLLCVDGRDVWQFLSLWSPSGGRSMLKRSGVRRDRKIMSLAMV
jgi:hypothetical protein